MENILDYIPVKVSQLQLFHKVLPVTKTILLQCKISTSPRVNFQQNLPHLPVPNLRETLKKYLRSVEPLLTEQEFQDTQKVTEEFGKEDGIGEKLQALLLEKAKHTENWLEKWWLETAYLAYRVPVIIHSSPGIVFPFQTFKTNDDYLYYVTKLIVASMEYKYEIDNDKIPLEKMGNHLLDMSQYTKFFGTMRVPMPACDAHEFHPTAHHIVVAHKNHFFRLRLFCDNNEPLSEEQIFPQLKKITEDSQKPAEPIGILSSDHRDKWAETFGKIIKDPLNQKSITIMKRSLFLVCLDESTLKNTKEPLNIAGHQCMHGGGSEQNSGNRWFDKTVQFVIGKDGVVGLCYEHSPSEGQPIAVMTEYLVNYITSGKKRTTKARGTLQNAEKLEFNITQEIRTAITEASKKLDKLVGDLDLECACFKKYGKGFVKTLKLSPDSFFQMGMQFAYYRLYKQAGAHYESAATRKYMGGRTETIRSCSMSSVEFAKAMLNPDSSEVEKKDTMMKAVLEHKKYSIDANNGYGVDRHLLGLKLIALENNLESPEFFSDKGYVKSTHFLITSSQVATKCGALMVYGPTAWDGYAICYNPRNADMYYAVSAFRSNRKTDAKQMKASLEKSLVDMHDIVLKTT